MSFDLHRGHVKSVLCWLRQHGLSAKPEKCKFEQQSIQFLSLIISIEGVKMGPQEVSAILDWPAPTDKKRVQHFVGFATSTGDLSRDSPPLSPHHANYQAELSISLDS